MYAHTRAREQASKRASERERERERDFTFMACTLSELSILSRQKSRIGDDTNGFGSTGRADSLAVVSLLQCLFRADAVVASVLGTTFFFSFSLEHFLRDQLNVWKTLSLCGVHKRGGNGGWDGVKYGHLEIRDWKDRRVGAMATS